MHSILRSSRSPLRRGACLGLCALWIAAGQVGAEPTVPTWGPEADTLDWTGRPASREAARKEAGAALVEGRRQCARERQRTDRQACQQQVLDDYQSAMKRLNDRPAKRGR